MNTEATVAEDDRYSPEKLKARGAKGMLYIGIASIVMLFSAFCSAFIVSKGGNFWVNLILPQAFWISTAIILLSSLTVNMALSYVKRNSQKMTSLFLSLTLMLGVLFSVYQWIGWGQLIERGNYFVGNIMDPDESGFFVKGEYGKDFTLTFDNKELDYKEGRFFFPDGKELSAVQYENLKRQRNTASSYIYIFTALHLLHLIGGLIYLIFVTLASYRGKYNAENHLRISLIAIYWHFLDLLWILLFVFLQFIH